MEANARTLVIEISPLRRRQAGVECRKWQLHEEQGLEAPQLVWQQLQWPCRGRHFPVPIPTKSTSL
jgi:hypothetical protein